MENSQLWGRTLGEVDGKPSPDRERLRQALLKFRSRVDDLVSSISSELPGLTVHDVTHLDGLWHVADEVLGQDYPINAAEAFVLGGAILLHDSAHAVAAYPGRLSEIKAGPEWSDFVSLRLMGVEPACGTEEEKYAIFNVLRDLHAKQAEKLPWVSWQDSSGNQAYLLEDAELRAYFGGAIGLVAASHHWDAGIVPERLKPLSLTPAGFLKSTKWEVDLLKLAMILRIIDAAHIDAQRAPWFLFALKNPSGISRNHWKFQGKIGRIVKNSANELVVAGSPFNANEQAAWWLAYDTATMIDAEIRESQRVLADYSRLALPLTGVSGVQSTARFSQSLPVDGWVPIDVRPKIGDVPSLIERLGGAALYGDDPAVALRELLQNSIDACHAYECVVARGARLIEVIVEETFESDVKISIRDNGIGMSKHVLTQVLMDFGKSLWSSSDVMTELPGLVSSGFNSGGKFGIGFYSVFMLGQEVRVTTRRFERVESDASEQWMLCFSEGLRSRPSLQIPGKENKLASCGTEVCVVLRQGTFQNIINPYIWSQDKDSVPLKMVRLIKGFVPACPYDVDLVVGGQRQRVINGDDWKEVEDAELLSRADERPMKLWPVSDRDGKLVGRVRPAGLFESGAVGVVRGVAAATHDGLKGLVFVSGNNSDAKRSQAIPYSNVEDWRRWATLILSDSADLDCQESIALHPLLPRVDMKVWIMRGENMSLERVKSNIKKMNELVVHFGEIEHDDDDDMASWRFDHDFKLDDSVLLAPDNYYIDWEDDSERGYPRRGRVGVSAFPWVLGVPKIKYMEILCEAIEQVWGPFTEEEEDSHVVGTVDGSKISRSCIKFVRTGL